MVQPVSEADQAPYGGKKRPLFSRDAQVVIIGGGPAGLHFASKMIKEGYRKPVVLEATNRPGGKAHTVTLPDAPALPHEMGTCYLHRGYGKVRELLEEYGLGDQELLINGEFEEGADPGGPERIGRMVWDIHGCDDLCRDREGGLGQDFDDWILSTGVEGIKLQSQRDADAQLESEIAKAHADSDLSIAMKQLCRDMIRHSFKPETDEVNFAASKFLSGVKGQYESEKKRAFEDKDGDGHPDVSGLRKLLARLRMAKAAGKYIRKHREIFGEYLYGLPPPPKDPKEIDCTFREWLDRNDLHALVPFFMYSQAAQGYGVLDTMPAFYGLWWSSPEFMQMTLTITGNLSVSTPIQSVLKCGFSALFECMVEQEGINVRYNSWATNVDRRKEGVWITYEHKTPSGSVSEETIQADAVVVAIPFKQADKRGVLELSASERAVIDPLFGTTFKTTLVATKLPPTDLTFGEQFWLGPTLGYTGRLRAVRYSSIALSGEHVEEKPRMVAYQIVFEPPTPELGKKLKKVLLKDMKTAGFQEPEIEAEKTWDYFWQFPQDAINEGAPWKLLDMQGDDRTVWIGGSACFESVLDVVCYNDLIWDLHSMSD